MHIDEPVRVIARGHALPTSAVGKVVVITDVDTRKLPVVYGFTYAGRMVWGRAEQFSAVLASDPTPFPLPLSE